MFIVFAVSSQIIHKAKAEAPIRTVQEMSLQEVVYHYAEEYGTPGDVLNQVMLCESRGEQDTKGDHGMSHGIFQIQTETWKRFTKEMGESLDINSPIDQSKVAAWAFANGHAGEWTTYVALKNGGTYTFWYKLEKRYYTVHCKMEKGT